ncbi:MAG: hypothetical protein IPG62_00305 [Sphingomonadales bacterium]|nr:hypothetical protein [Sphingomonadales bacterium]
MQDRIVRVEGSGTLQASFRDSGGTCHWEGAIIFACLVLAVPGTQFLPKKYTGRVQLAFAPAGISLIKTIADPGLSDAARSRDHLNCNCPLACRGQSVVKSALQRIPRLPPKPVASNRRCRRSSSGGSSGCQCAACTGQTPLIELTYTSSDPIKAAKIANAIADSYLQHQVAQKLAQSKSTLDRLDSRVELLRQQAGSSRCRSRGLQSTQQPDQPDSWRSSRKFPRSAPALADARAIAAEAQSRHAAASRSTIVSNSGPIDNNTLSVAGHSGREVVRKVGALSARYNDKHPLIIDAKEELARIDGEIRTEMRGLSRPRPGLSPALPARAASLQRQPRGRHAHGLPTMCRRRRSGRA